MSKITTHVLDVSVGRPAAGVPVQLEIKKPNGGWKELGKTSTDRDGRVQDIFASGSLAEGTYRLNFDTQAYFRSRKVEGLYPHIAIEFHVRDSKQHYHIPLLLSPFGYSTYRGS